MTVSGGWTQPEAPCEPPGDSCGLRLCSESLWKRRCSRNTLIPPETSKAQVQRGGLPLGLPPAPLGRRGSPGCSLSPGEGSGAGGRRPSHPVSPGPSSPWPWSLSGGSPQGWGRGRARSSSWEVSGAVAAGPGLGLGDRPTRPPERSTDGWPGAGFTGYTSVSSRSRSSLRTLPSTAPRLVMRWAKSSGNQPVSPSLSLSPYSHPAPRRGAVRAGSQAPRRGPDVGTPAPWAAVPETPGPGVRTADHHALPPGGPAQGTCAWSGAQLRLAVGAELAAASSVRATCGPRSGRASRCPLGKNTVTKNLGTAEGVLERA